MKPLSAFLHKQAPRAGTDMPAYFRRALSTSEVLLVVYFLLSFALYSWSNQRLMWMPAAMAVAMFICRESLGRINVRVSFYLFELLIAVWCAWQTWAVGWRYGAQHLLIPMLMLCFFNIYEPPVLKLVTFFAVIAYRMGLFAYSLEHAAVFDLTRGVVIACQAAGSLVLFSCLGVCYITFSSSVQENERVLLLNNQELHREAGTDPLTQLPNRRAMLDVMESYLAEHSDEPFSVAIADIDFFKKVNDTYGHNCGDYTLKQLSDLFLASAAGKYKVCRWGGEEFCFFLPGMNLDAASVEMQNLNTAVRKMPLHFGDDDYYITITIGVEENDYHSSMEDILGRADRKLYMGKVHGRNQVVM